MNRPSDTGFTSISRRFDLLVESDPGSIALIDGSTGAETTRSELRLRARAIAAELTRAGAVGGELVGVKLPNGSDFVATVLACLSSGLSILPLDRDANEREVAALVEQFRVSWTSRVSPWREAFPLISRTEQAAAPPLTHALLKLSSGSSGKPKGIATTEENLIADCRNICSTMGLTATDRNLGAIPFSHSYGFSNLVTPLLVNGTTIIVTNDYLPLSILQLANLHECTFLPGIPMLFDHLARLPLEDGGFRTVRTFISAGAPLTPATSSSFARRFDSKIHTFYGCSETGGIAYDREGGAAERNSVGSALDGVGLSTEAASGRLLVSSQAVAAGYLQPGAQRELTTFGDGRFLTDDLVDVSAGAEISIRGRITELINTAGKKVNPREVESTLMQLDGVIEARVYGEPAGARGDVVAAAIVGSPGLTREQVRDFCRARLSPHKVPRIVKFIQAMPTDQRGKIKLSELATL